MDSTNRELGENESTITTVFFAAVNAYRAAYNLRLTMAVSSLLIVYQILAIILCFSGMLLMYSGIWFLGIVFICASQYVVYNSGRNNAVVELAIALHKLGLRVTKPTAVKDYYFACLYMTHEKQKGEYTQVLNNELRWDNKSFDVGTPVEDVADKFIFSFSDMCPEMGKEVRYISIFKATESGCVFVDLVYRTGVNGCWLWHSDTPASKYPVNWLHTGSPAEFDGVEP